jgi:hypothetical protein
MRESGVHPVEKVLGERGEFVVEALLKGGLPSMHCSSVVDFSSTCANLPSR